jgi:hypothetical protein
MTISDDRDRLIHILVVHFDMFRAKAEEAADLFLHDKTLAARRSANTPVGDGWVEGVLFDLVLKHFNGKLSREEHEEIRDTLRRSIAARMPASPSLPSQVVDDKTIERAAKAIAESAGDVAWEKIEPLYQEGYRDEALAALAALTLPERGM